MVDPSYAERANETVSPSEAGEEVQSVALFDGTELARIESVVGQQTR